MDWRMPRPLRTTLRNKVQGFNVLVRVTTFRVHLGADGGLDQVDGGLEDVAPLRGHELGQGAREEAGRREAEAAVHAVRGQLERLLPDVQLAPPQRVALARQQRLRLAPALDQAADDLRGEARVQGYSTYPGGGEMMPGVLGLTPALDQAADDLRAGASRFWVNGGYIFETSSYPKCTVVSILFGVSPWARVIVRILQNGMHWTL